MKDLGDNRQGWIDFCRGFAMIAVVIDHTQMLYPKFVAPYIIFAVPMFVFLGGITSSISLEKTTSPHLKYIWKRLKPILLSYAIATAAYRIFTDGWAFSASNYLWSLLLFNVTSPFYFLAFYLQLIAVSRTLYWYLNRYDSIAYKLACLAILYLLSSFLMNHARILNLHGGGAFLLGGSYLFVFALGMVCSKPITEIASNPKMVLSLFAFSLFMLITSNQFGWIDIKISNPPLLKAILYMLSMAGLIISSFHLVKSSRNFMVSGGLLCISTIGKHSLYIYLYHFLVLLIICNTQLYYYALTYDLEKLIVQTSLCIGIPLCMALTHQAVSRRLKTGRVSYKIDGALRVRQ